MTATLQPDGYALDRKLEEERLTLQSRAFLDRISERMLREAGLEPGMHVLDLGSGMADTALLAAGIVGPTGRVTGVEHDPGTLAAARERLRRLGTTNVELVEGDVSALEALRSAAAVVRPGGLVADIEFDLDGIDSHPPARLFDWFAVLFCELYVRLGTHPRMGLELRPAFLDAGFPEPVLRTENAVVGDPDDVFFGYLAETLRSAAPAMEATGVIAADELDLETVEERLRAEIAQTGGVVCGPTVVGAWART
jgi:SAM-dependent methyltransferase